MASITSTGTSSRQLAALKLLRRRLIQAVPLMLGVVVINFCLIQLAPGSFLELMTAEFYARPMGSRIRCGCSS